MDEELTEVEVSRIHSIHEQYCQGSYNAPLKRFTENSLQIHLNNDQQYTQF